RHGDRPEWLEVASSELLREVVESAGTRTTDDGTIAIIAPSGLHAELREELRRRDLEFGDASTGVLSTSIELLDPAMAKGLEFDHVYLVEPTAIMREGHEDRRFQELYVAL